MTIKEHQYTLIIPTRNRQHNAIHAIQSAIACDYQKLQIVVTDNSDDDSLKNLISQRGWAKHVQYYKTEKTLAMHENWSKGLDLSEGEYVSIIGDDDAIFPDAPLVCNVLLSQKRSQVIATQCAEYKWPDYPFPGRRNYLSVPMGHKVVYVNAVRRLLRDAIGHKVDLGTGPGIYRGFVERNFLEMLKNKRGAWFVEHQPDLDSGYCTLMYAEGFIVNSRPMFMDGHCGKSNSGAMRSSPMMTNSLINFTKEIGQGSEVFPNNWPVTVRSAIIAGQERLLPEIRKALNDYTLVIDKKRAWEHMSKGAQQGYDANAVNRDAENLQKLAYLWGIDKQVQHDAKITLGLSTHEEQGLIYLGEDIEGSEKVEKITYVRIDGNAVEINNINQALALANAMIAPIHKLVETRNSERYNYLISHRFKHHKAIMQQAQFAFNTHQLTRAEELVLRVCSENSLDADAYASLGNIRIQLSNFTDAAAVYARAMSIKPTFTVAERFVWVLCQLGQIENARELIEQVRSEAIKANLHSLVIAMESHVATAQQFHSEAADSK